MRLLFDFRNYQYSYQRGIGRYILALAEHIAKYSDIDISVLISKDLPSVEFSDNIRSKITVYTIEDFDNYEITENFDFFFKGNYIDPHKEHEYMYPKKVLKKCNDIVGILYDFIPLIFAGNYLKNNQNHTKQYSYQFEELKYSSHFFTISNCTKNDSIKYLNKPAEYFTTIYGGADTEKFKSENSEKEYIANERRNNIVFITGDDKRKNYLGAAKAFAMAYETGDIPQDAKLYLICSCDKAFIKNTKKAVKNYKADVGTQIIITNYISDKELIEILSTAKASIFPSYYEGLGLPILESYIAGTPSFASNLSSTKEFVNKESSFNPYDLEEMRDVIIQIFNDENYCKQSLEFGRELIKKINWDNAAKITVNKLKELVAKKKPKTADKVAVFGILPPETSGIASYTYKTHSIAPEKYDIFSDIKNPKAYNDLLSNEEVKNIFPINFYEYADRKEHYKSKIFILGNSEHHIKILEKAIETKGTDNRYLYLHEAYLYFLLYPYFEYINQPIQDFISKYYPIAAGKNLYNLKTAQELNIYGIKLLVELTGIKNIIVNNEKAKELIQKEVGEEYFKSLNVTVLFHPIEKIEGTAENLRNTPKQYLIGSFGIPTESKMSDKLIDAVKILNKNNGKNTYKLILAGYLVDKYLGYNKCDFDFIEAYDSPTKEKLYNLMKSVDLTVQLRPNSLGESSGCVTQLLGLNQNILTSEGFVSKDQEECCHILSGETSAEELAEKIAYAAKNKKVYDSDKLAEKYSFLNLSNMIYELTVNKHLE